MRLALLLTPDDRIATTWAIRRGAALLERNGGAPLGRAQRRRLLRGRKDHSLWIGFGLGLYHVIRFRPFMALLFLISIPVLVWQVVSGVTARIL